MHMLWDLQDGPADDPGGPGAPGGGSGDASEAAEPLDTLSDVESDEAEEDKQCAAPAAGTLCMPVSSFAARVPWIIQP